MAELEIVAQLPPVKAKRSQLVKATEERGLILMDEKQLEGIRRLGETVHHFGTVTTADGYVVMTQQAVSKMLAALVQALDEGKVKGVEDLQSVSRTVAVLAKAMVPLSTALKGSQVHEPKQQKGATFQAGARVLFSNCTFKNDHPGQAQ